jgi:hypothetical protein
MSKSRRKTLSHTEIENFLFDLTTQPAPPSAIEESNLTKTTTTNHDPPKTSDLKESIRAIYQVSFYPPHTLLSHPLQATLHSQIWFLI